MLVKDTEEASLSVCFFVCFFQTFYSVFGVVGGPVVGVFCLGMFTRRANSRVCINFYFQQTSLCY